MNIQERSDEMDDRFTWKEDDLEIEDPPGSGQFIPLREFNKRIAAAKSAQEARHP